MGVVGMANMRITDYRTVLRHYGGVKLMAVICWSGPRRNYVSPPVPCSLKPHIYMENSCIFSRAGKAPLAVTSSHHHIWTSVL